jgi:DNA-binding beta-propeller fold protein YncE
MDLVCLSEPRGCGPDNPSRDVSLVPGEQIKSSVFLPTGTDIRGFLLSKDGKTAYVLHRNTPESSGSANPEALVFLDRRVGRDGQPSNQASDEPLEICSGATRMEFQETSRGTLLFITCYEGGQIYVVDPEKHEVSAIIEAGHGPTALTFSETDKTVAYVADYADNNVSVIDLKPGSPTEYMITQRIGFPHTVTE